MMALLVPVAAMLFVASVHLVVIGDAQSGSVGGKCRHINLHNNVVYIYILEILSLKVKRQSITSAKRALDWLIVPHPHSPTGEGDGRDAANAGHRMVHSGLPANTQWNHYVNGILSTTICPSVTKS